MIPDAISSLTVSALNIVLSMLPSADPSQTDFITQFYYFVQGYIPGIDWLVPTQDLFAVLRIVFMLEATIFIFKFLRYIIRLISLGFIQI